MDDSELIERLDRIEATLVTLVEVTERQHVKEWYTVDEFAAIVNREPFTVREYARLGRLHASKTASGRGRSQNWVFSHAELERFRREGLLADPRRVVGVIEKRAQLPGSSRRM
jgi:hypothetical protein